ncbi:MAG TPA: hypothetical protein VM009_06315 [Terriglobales bacterium]|nr:hypothetical protein [Terriglobales bacterium]
MSSPPAGMLDGFLPEFHVRSAHEITIEADITTAYAALCGSSFSESRLVRALLRIRNFGRPLPQCMHAPSLLDALERGGFLRLATTPGQEVVFAIAGRFWLPHAERVALRSVEEFQQFARPGYAKAAWNIALYENGPTRTRLCTQTRVLCYGRAATIAFRSYWFVVGPFSGLTRITLLRQVKRRAQAASRQAAHS